MNNVINKKTIIECYIVCKINGNCKCQKSSLIERNLYWNFNYKGE